MFDFKVLSITKFMYYIGFDTELLCQSPSAYKNYHIGPPSSTSRIGHDFEKNSSVYFTSIRSWYDAALQQTGFASYVSTYIFASSGNVGSTLSQTVLDSYNVARSVLGFDIIPYSSFDENDPLLSKLLFDQSSQSFDYFMINSEKAVTGNYDKDSIVDDLVRMIYLNPGDTTTETAAKKTEISNSFKIESFEDLKGVKIEYISYTFQGDKKYLFFSDVDLFEARRDGTYQIRNVNRLGFTGSSNALEGDLRDTINNATANVIWVHVLGAFVIILIGIIVGVFASRIFANTLVDPFINLCIKMKIAQNEQSRIRKMQHQKKIHLSDAELMITSKTDSKPRNEFQKLYEKIENALKVFKMKNFKLLEGAEKKYYNLAKIRYQQILEIYIKMDEDLPSIRAKKLNNQQLVEICDNLIKYKRIQRK